MLATAPATPTLQAQYEAALDASAAAWDRFFAHDTTTESWDQVREDAFEALRCKKALDAIEARLDPDVIPF